MATTTLHERLQIIANKSGKTLAEVQNAYQEALNTLPSSLDTKQKEKYALKRVNNDLSINARSTAIAYEAVLVGAGQVRDLMKGIKDQALQAYQNNPVTAINTGIVSFDTETQRVTVLDNRKEINGNPNKNFGKPRPEHMFVREVIGAFRKPGEKNFTKGKITLWNQSANLQIPIGKLIGFKANGGLEGSDYRLKSSVGTQFDIKQDLPKEEVLRIINSVFENDFKALGECLDYHRSVKNTDKFFDRLVVTEGTVAFVNISSDESKNHRISLNDDTLPEGSRSINVWVPYKIGNMLDFGRGSIVTIIAQTGTGKGWDSENKCPTDEEVLQLNAYSVFGIPGLTTQPDEPGELI
ncbi:MAG: hypothetical protein ACRENZ_01155 [Thermodesulfobacteriota bacterium]